MRVALLVLMSSCSLGMADPPTKPATTDWHTLHTQWKQRSGQAIDQARSGRILAAEKSFQEALTMARRLYPRSDYPKGHRDLAISLANLASHSQGLEKFDQAGVLYREALDIYEKATAEDHESIAQTSGSLGQVLMHQGKLDRAEFYFRKALDAQKHSEEKDNGVTAATLCDLAGLLDEQGKLVEAELFMNDALTMYRRLYPQDKFSRGHPALAVCIYQSGLIHAKQGKFENAEENFREALEMFYRLIPQKENPYTANVLNSLAGALHKRGELEDAEDSFRQALGIMKRLHQGDNFGVSSCMNNLANVLMDQRKYGKAEPLLRDAIQMRKRLFRDDHPKTALSLNNLGTLLSNVGRYDEAMTNLTEALEIQQRLFRDDHPETALFLFNLAVLMHRQGDHQTADGHYRKSLAMSRRLVSKYATNKSEGEALTLAATTSNRFGFALSNAIRLDTRIAYEHVWENKGVILRAFENRLRLARVELPPEFDAIKTSLNKMRQRRADLILSSNATASTEHQHEILRITEEIEALNKRLTHDLSRTKRTTENPSDLQNALATDSLLIDFVRVDLFEQDAKIPGHKGESYSLNYVAFVITKEKLDWVDLGPADVIDQAIKEWRQSITNGIPTSQIANRVRELIWQPIRIKIPKSIKMVYVAPDVNLCNVPWAGIPGDKINSILLDDFAVSVAPNASSLLQQFHQHKSSSQNDIFLGIGGVDYGNPVANDSKHASAVRGKTRIVWPTLNGALSEVRDVSEMARKKQATIMLLNGEQATRAAFLDSISRARFAHIATHGFFADSKFQSILNVDPNLFESSRLGERIGLAVQNPLVMTGLVFADANRPDTPGHGIVTGESFVDLDLSRLELVVLSACESGIGDVASREGVFGLQRAFQLAGTRNVVASLWKVSDQATSALMEMFYQNLWNKNMQPTEALRHAQLEIYRNPNKYAVVPESTRGKFEEVDGTDLRNSVSEKNQRAHPRLWAAFILSGPGF